MSKQSAVETAVTDAVIWCDFGGVISGGLDRAFEEVAEAAGVSWPDIAAAAVAVAADVGLAGFQPLELGTMPQREWGERVADVLGADDLARTVLRDFDVHYYRTRTVDHELLDGLQLFRNRGLTLGMLTNSVLEWEPHRTGLLAGTLHFDHYLRSHEVGIAKPDPAIYELADTLLGSTDSRRLLIDDLEVNCVAAEAHGWSAIRHRDTQETLAQLEVWHG